MNRRTFLEILTAAAVLPRHLSFAADEHRIEKIGLQLYTVRDQLKADFDGTIAKVASMGYKEVEFAGYFGHNAGAGPSRDRSSNVSTSPLLCTSNYAVLRRPSGFPSSRSSKLIGQSYIVCPWIPEEIRKHSPTAGNVPSTPSIMPAKSAKKSGIQFAYHNHWFEFLPVNGKFPYDTLLEQCDPDLVKMELDLCWITVAGARPLDLFQPLPWTLPASSRERHEEAPQGFGLRGPGLWRLTERYDRGRQWHH